MIRAQWIVYPDRTDSLVASSVTTAVAIGASCLSLAHCASQIETESLAKHAKIAQATKPRILTTFGYWYSRRCSEICWRRESGIVRRSGIGILGAMFRRHVAASKSSQADRTSRKRKPLIFSRSFGNRKLPRAWSVDAACRKKRAPQHRRTVACSALPQEVAFDDSPRSQGLCREVDRPRGQRRC